MKKANESVVWGVIALLCILAFPVIGYVGGRLCMPLSVLALPAQVVPTFIWLIAVVMLGISIIRAIVTRRHIPLACGALVIALLSTWAFISFYSPCTARLYGLRDRFVQKVGYPKMREFANELAHEQNLVLCGYQLSDESKPMWDDLVARYPFVSWNDGSGTIMVGNGSVALTWGSPLVGHWGFEVSLDGRSHLAEDRWKSLRVSEDIRFIDSED